MDPANPGSVNSGNPLTPATPLVQPTTPASFIPNPLTPAANIAGTPFNNGDYPFLGQGTAGGTPQQLDVARPSPAPSTPLAGPSSLPLRSPAPALFVSESSSRSVGPISAANPLLASLVEPESTKPAEMGSDQLNYRVDTSQVDVLYLLKFGEEILTEIMTRTVDMLSNGRTQQLPQFGDSKDHDIVRRYLNAYSTCEKTLPGYFKRLRYIQDAVSLEMDSLLAEVEVTPEKILPLCGAGELGSEPSAYEDELQRHARPELWKEYVKLTQTLRKRDEYLKIIIDEERAMLHQMNSSLFPA